VEPREDIEPKIEPKIEPEAKEDEQILIPSSLETTMNLIMGVSKVTHMDLYDIYTPKPLQEKHKELYTAIRQTELAYRAPVKNNNNMVLMSINFIYGAWSICPVFINFEMKLSKVFDQFFDAVKVNKKWILYATEWQYRIMCQNDPIVERCTRSIYCDSPGQNLFFKDIGIFVSMVPEHFDMPNFSRYKPLSSAKRKIEDEEEEIPDPKPEPKVEDIEDKLKTILSALEITMVSISDIRSVVGRLKEEVSVLSQKIDNKPSHYIYTYTAPMTLPVDSTNPTNPTPFNSGWVYGLPLSCPDPNPDPNPVNQAPY
jgi:hypothetical protein